MANQGTITLPKSREDERKASLSRAEQRLKEIRGLADAGGGDGDQFWAPEPPDGFEYEWKRKTIYGQEDPSYAIELVRQGWEPVPLFRHLNMMPHGWQGDIIERGGQVLMERPKVLCDESRALERAKTKADIQEKEAQLGLAAKPFGKASVSVRKSIEPMSIPADE